MSITDHKGIKSDSPSLGPGDLFGEISLLLGQSRTATVKTSKYSTIAYLTKNDFDTVCHQFPAFAAKLKNKMKEYKDSYKLFTKELVKNVDYICNLSDDTIEEVTYYLEQRHYEKDKIIFRAGDSIECIHFITNGTVKITVSINDSDVPIDTLYRG